MITSYDRIINDINELLELLNSLGIDASLKSHLENDFLLATDFVEKYNNSKHDELTEQGRTALGGLHELYKWIWSIKDSDNFGILVPHLQMLSESATRINSKTPMISPVTGKQDDKTNKLIETIVAMFAIKVGVNVDLDDPVESSDGKNPDIIFDYSNRRIAIACKTLRGCSENAVLDNLSSAAKQIERAECDIGYLAINAMNILPHDRVCDRVFNDLAVPFKLVTTDLVDLYESTKNNCSEELYEIFEGAKIRPVILTFVHSCTRLTSPVGNISTMIKSTFATVLKDYDGIEEDVNFLSGVNEFIHNRL